MREFQRTVQSLSDETRGRILNLVTFKECCVCEVMQALGISQTRASRNLKVLADAGFLNVRTEGLFTLYVVKTDFPKPYFPKLLDAVKVVTTQNDSAKRDIEMLKHTKRVMHSRVYTCD